MARNNIWKMTAKDAKGQPVESHPGMKTFLLRGPESLVTVKQHATILLNAMRQREFDNTGEDPGYVVDKIEPAGHSEQTELIGEEWRPVGAQPINLPLPRDENEPRPAKK